MIRLARMAGPAVLLAAALAAALVGLWWGGAAQPTLVDPGDLVRFGLPIAKLLTDLGFAAALGALLLAVFALPPDGPALGRALDVAAAGAAVWTVAGAGAAFFQAASLYSSPPRLDEAYGAQLGAFLTDVGIGRAWLAFVLAGALVTVICFAVRNRIALVLTLVGSAISIVYLVGEGHSGSSDVHDIAVTATWLHVIFVSLWVGGLLTLVVIRRDLPARRLAPVLLRYSTVALVAFIVVAASGYLSAAVRVGDLPALLTPYGLLVLVKVGALAVLGALGALYRRWILRLVAAGRDRAFWALVLGELAVMGIATGMAAALARTAPPVDDAAALIDPTPAEILVDRPLPPELTAIDYLTAWRIDLLWVLVVAFGTFFYVAGVVRLHRRGDRWPVHRTLLWLAGMAGLLWATNGVMNVYGPFLFSVHMLGHMVLSMAVPALLVLAAPITLALRAVDKRDDGSRGAREWIMVAIHSPAARVLTHPLVASAIFAGSLWAFYYTPLFRWAVLDHVGHTWMNMHFLISGYLFVLVLVGVDPIPSRPPYPLRLLLLLGTMAFHAFFGLAIMTGEGLLLADWYGAMGREWGDPPLVDQQVAGGIAWSVGEIPTVSLAILVAVMWSRADKREARRSDRAADRDGDAELAAYNAMLAEQARRDAR